MKNRPFIVHLLLILLLHTSCEKDSGLPDPDFPRIRTGEGTFVINEGNFQWGNATLSYYDKGTGRIHHDLYARANGEELGDVFHSMLVHEDLAYLVVNNSGKIEVIDPVTCRRQGTIDGLASPRFMLPVASSKAYVSNLFGGQISIIDLGSYEVTGSIPVPGWNEELADLSGMVMVAGVETGSLYMIDPLSDELTDSIYVGHGPVSFEKDARGHLWVLCAGDWMSGTGGALVQISKDNFRVNQTRLLPGFGGTFSSLAASPDKNTLYVIGDGIYALSVEEEQAEAQLLIPASGRTFYGLDVDPENGWIYVGDAIDFTQAGKVMVFDANGNELDTIEAMHNPRGFLFY